MFELRHSTRLVMFAGTTALSATLAACDGSTTPPAIQPVMTPAPVESPTAQYINSVGLTIITPNADRVEPDPVDPAPAPTAENEEPVPVS